MQSFQTIFFPPCAEIPLIQSITTYGAFRHSELETISGIQIREEPLREMITNTLKLCYLFEPIMKGLEQLNSYEKSGSLIKVSSLLTVLKKGLFYRHMIKFSLQNDVTVALVNNRLTETNIRVVIAAILVFASKRLKYAIIQSSLDEIASSMLIFSLEEALLGLRPFGLPLQLSSLQKILKKIDRVISTNDLKKFISTSKDERDSNYIQPDQFLYLTAISRKKSTSSVIFFERKRIRNLIIPEINVETHEEKSKEESKIIITEVAREKVRGISMHTPRDHEKVKTHNEIFKEIKNCLQNKKRTKSVQFPSEANQKSRPHSPYYQKSLTIFKKAIKVQNFIENEKQKLCKLQQNGKKLSLHRKKCPLRIRGVACD